MTDKEFIAHVGVLGMKWGKHKSKNQVNKVKVTSEDHNNVKALRKKSVSEMSNKELEMLTRRMQLEKQYKDLNKNEVTKGKSIVDSMLKSAKTANEIYNLYNSPMSKAVKAKIKTKG